jgi:RNA polymerase sigma factor (sigma-70 family)
VGETEETGRGGAFLVPTRDNKAVLRHIRTLLELGTVGDLTDTQLLERFTTRCGEAAELAFAALVERHGPMVQRVCGNLLRDPHDAQDAYQATFLILLQKSRSLWVRDSLGPWLHRVAHRVASRVRCSATRRRQQERRAAELRAALRPTQRDISSDLYLLHEEIDRLPERYRVPVVLCDLEGVTHQRAARQLGWPLGTVKSRLGRARELLRGRLGRRGLLLPASFLIGDRSSTAADGGFCATANETIRRISAHILMGENGVVAVPSTRVAILSKGVLRTMFLAKFKLASVVLIVAGAVVAGTAGVLAQPGPQTKGAEQPGTKGEFPGTTKGEFPGTTKGEFPGTTKGEFPGTTNGEFPGTTNGELPVVPGKSSDVDSESAPAYISRSRAMIITQLEAELAKAKQRFEHMQQVARSPDDPVLAHMRSTIDGLRELLAGVDTVLLKAVERHPTAFDFSRAAEPKADLKGVLDRQVSAETSALLQAAMAEQTARAASRADWAARMLQKGYISKSQADAERSNQETLQKAHRLIEQALRAQAPDIEHGKTDTESRRADDQLLQALQLLERLEGSTRAGRAPSKSADSESRPDQKESRPDQKIGR